MAFIARGQCHFATTEVDSSQRMDEYVTIPARLLPRDAADFMIGSAVGLLQCVVLVLVPAFLGWSATGSVWAAVATGLGLYLLFLAHTVKSLDVGVDGVHFNRWLGRPKLIPWSEFRSAGIATRRELVLRGWLWPPFPAREMTPSYTSLGHCRFDTADGRVLERVTASILAPPTPP